MGLIVSGYVSKLRGAVYAEQDHLMENEEHPTFQLYLELGPEYLEAYNMDGGDELEGEILHVGATKRDTVDELEGDDITFIVTDKHKDRIFLSEYSFEKFREWGFVSEGYYLSVLLDKAIIDGDEVDIYSKRDVKA